jgi:sec-independent protein translocase protein TatA|uniref:Sec-independent protein translocase protein TatA n=1 Tax=candidate division WOR-3 bacterium TaxID=2052148 RepID=A0A7C4U6S4_UNCW3
MFGTIGWPEIIIILLLVLLLFGAKRLPEIGKSLGKGLREFKDALKGIDEEDKKEKGEEDDK